MKTAIRVFAASVRCTSSLFGAIWTLSTLSASGAMGGYRWEGMVSDVPDAAAFTDTNLVNAWGILAENKGLVVCATETSLAGLYSNEGQPEGAYVSVPGGPTGLTWNESSGGFRIPGDRKPRPSDLIFVTEDGMIRGWHSHLPTDVAVVGINRSAAGAVYKGVTMVRQRRGEARLFAANFRGNAVEMFNESWQLIGTFTDPDVDAGFAPFNVVNINGQIFVTFALRETPDQRDDVPGSGNGFVDVFDTEGQFVRRFASRGVLNSPWAVVQAPKKFGQFSNAVLIGNFGNGAINAFDPDTGAFLGALPDAQGNVLHIPGLWGLAFGKAKGHKGDVLYYTAGPGDESHGAIGMIFPNDARPVRE